MLLGSIYLKNFNFIKKLFYLNNFDWIILLLSFPPLYSFNFLNIFFIKLFLCITGYFSNYFSFYSFISLNFIYLFFYFPPHFFYNIFYHTTLYLHLYSIFLKLIFLNFILLFLSQPQSILHQNFHYFIHTTL